MDTADQPLEQQLRNTREELLRHDQQHQAELEQLRSENRTLSMTVEELNHRARNLLLVATAIATQLSHRSSDASEFGEAFAARMQSLGLAFDSLTIDRPSDVPLGELLQAQLAPFAEQGKFSASGPHVRLTAKAALALDLAFYELATNAVKYGALASPGGHVDISWKLCHSAADGDALVICWQEHGGPGVSSPRREGFGSDLIRRQIPNELKGSATVDVSGDGMCVTLAFPTRNAVSSKRLA